MTRFLNLIATEPEIARVPIMVDSSKWSVIEAGLKCVQGKAIVNSISLKEGEADFLEKARLVRSATAPRVVVMAFDERPGRHRRAQGRDLRARLPSCSPSRSASSPTDIIFDPNILAIATGIEEHAHYAHELHRGDAAASRRPARARKISGGVSNLSFSFRGNDVVREAIHSAFLYHAIRAGMDMGIVNAGQLGVYEDIPQELLERVEDVLFDRRPDATERLVEFAEQVKGRRQEARAATSPGARRRSSSASRTRSCTASSTSSRPDTEEARQKLGAPAARDRRSADGRHEGRRRPVRRRQDVPAAGGEERARDEERGRLPEPFMEAESGRRARSASKGRIVMATVKGDVHDIGKNIVGVVLRLQRLRGDRPRRDGARRQDPRHRGATRTATWSGSRA